MTTPESPDPVGIAVIDELLHELAPESEPPTAPAWAAQLGGWLVVAVVEWPGAPAGAMEGLRRLCDVSEDAGDGRWMLAQHAPGGLADDPRAKLLVRTLRTTVIAQGGTRAAVAAAPGWPGETMLLGDAPETAAALFRTVVASGRHGLFVDATLHQFIDEPAAPFGEAYRLAGGARRPARRGVGRTGRVIQYVALAAGLVLGVGLYQRLDRAPEGQLFFHTAAATERGAPSLRSGDPLTIRLEGEAGSFGTVLLLDSADQWQLAAPSGTNHPFSQAAPRWAGTFRLDGQPGHERFFGVITPEPLADPQALLGALRQTAGARADAAQRLEAVLRVQGVQRARVVSTIEIEHRR